MQLISVNTVKKGGTWESSSNFHPMPLDNATEALTVNSLVSFVNISFDLQTFLEISENEKLVELGCSIRTPSMYYYSSFAGSTVILTPLSLTSAVHIISSPNSTPRILIMPLGIIVLDETPFVSPFPILLLYLNIIIPPINFLIFNSYFYTINSFTLFPSQNTIERYIYSNI